MKNPVPAMTRRMGVTQTPILRWYWKRNRNALWAVPDRRRRKIRRRRG